MTKLDKNRPVIIGIVGKHNSGKTTFITKVIKILKERGYKVCSVKHDPKGKAKVDTEGKDSYLMYKAGSEQVILVSPNKITSFVRIEREINPIDIIKNYGAKICDIYILEGFKWFKGFDKFEVIRKSQGENNLVLKDSDELKGIITDFSPSPFSPSFDINNPIEFVNYIENNYLNNIKTHL